MGDLMHKLHADQQRLDEIAETIPGLHVEHFDSPAKSPRAELLMAINAEQRTQIEALQGRIADLERTMAGMAKLIGQQRAKLRELEGSDLHPDAGCFIREIPIPGTEDAKVTLEISYLDGEQGVRSVFIGGRLVSPDDLISTLRSERDIKTAIDGWIAEERDAAAARRAEAYAEDA